MKRAILPALAVALLLAVPALPEDDAEDKIAALEEMVADQNERIAKLEAHVKASKAEAERLAKSLDAAEKGGFLFPAPNTDARKELLTGLQRYAAVAAGGKPKPVEDE